MQYCKTLKGFLNTGDHHIRGNQGMKDITLALHWIQDNIKNFGGDPNSVTVFGESAGGKQITTFIATYARGEIVYLSFCEIISHTPILD